MNVTFLVKSNKLFIQVTISWRIDVSCLRDGVGCWYMCQDGAGCLRQEKATSWSLESKLLLNTGPKNILQGTFSKICWLLCG